jgi:hypothetical protein
LAYLSLSVLGLLWELYHPANEDKKPDIPRTITDAKQQATPDTKQAEEEPVSLPVTPTQRSPLRNKWRLLLAIVTGAVLLSIAGIMIIPRFLPLNLTPPKATPTISATTIAPCAAPILVEPVDGQTLNSLTVTFTWEPPQGCRPDGYTVRITPNLDPEAKPWIVDTGWAPTYYKYTFSAVGTYYWHIRACEPCTPFNPGKWAIRVFTI